MTGGLSVWVWIGVAVCGGAASVGRHLIAKAFGRIARADLPIGIFAINVAGAFALGLLDGLGVSIDVSVLVGTATLGSFTTFSTWMLETREQRELGQTRWAAANAIVSLLVGFGAVALGRMIGAALG